MTGRNKTEKRQGRITGKNRTEKRQDRITGKNRTEKRQDRITVKDITMIGMMVAVIEVSKLALGFLPNIELTTFWLILFTLCFGWKIAFVVPVFILIEGAVYGFGLWWVMYLYVWPLLVLTVWIFRKREDKWFWAVLSGAFGLAFGFFCAIPYVVIGMGDGGIRDGLYAGFTWWVAGIPWDVVHGIGNFVLMMVLYSPVRRAIQGRMEIAG